MTKMEPNIEKALLYIPKDDGLGPQDITNLNHSWLSEEVRETMQDAKNWRELLENFRYMPNFKLEYIGGEMHRIKFVMKVQDSRWAPDPARPHIFNPPVIPISATIAMGSFIAEKYAIRRLRDVLQELALHEVDEWFRVNGELIFDPHADVAAKA